jgi:hypothetical protein
LISLGVNLFYIVLRFLFFKRKLLPYILLSLPSYLIEFWFERVGRPVYVDGANGKDLRKAGEDLEAKGLTEWMWDVVYWTWGTTAIVTLFGDWAWWLYAAVPLYSAYLAFTTYSGVRKGMGGMMGGGADEKVAAQGPSKRQTKMEKRGQKVQYR